VIFETTLPVGDTRDRFTPRLAEVSGLTPDEDLFVAFSPERLYSGAALRNLATYPKLVGGIGPRSTARAAAFYDAVLDAEIVAMQSAEAAEFSKLADTTYRDVNIALANEFARYAERVGVDIHEVIAAANSQPYSHIHEPGLGVGGHCIPVYPHFLLSRAPELDMVELARRTNDGQVGVAIRAIQQELGGLEGVPVLVLGLTYRHGVKELAYSRALPLIERLSHQGAVVSAYDPLLSAEETARCCATPWTWGEAGPFVAIITQTADPQFGGLNPAWFPELQVVFDGRNSLRAIALPDSVAYRGIGVPPRASGPRDTPARSGPSRSVPDRGPSVPARGR
jgi:nucleotide sugar dehydrogenase